MTRAFSLLCAIALVVSGACGNSTSSPSQVNVPYSQTDLVVGPGATAGAGSRATVTYTGWLYDGSRTDNKGNQFDSGSFQFVLGTGGVIRGFDQGVTGMRVGGTRRVTIPPDLGYGNNPPSGSGIPANATLVFEVTLTAVS